MQFRILGSLEIVDGERPVELRRAKPRTLLAALLLHPNQVVPTERLIEALWGDDAPPSAANTLQGYVSHLRQVLAPAAGGEAEGPTIRSRAPGYVLTVDPRSVDAYRFEQLVRDGMAALAAGGHRQAAGLIGEALSMWRGPALADFAGEHFASVEAARLEELRVAAFEHQAEAELALGRHADLVDRLQALVEEHPLRERLWGQLMVALYRGGRQAEALRAFQAARRILGEELGIDPGPALRRLESDVLAQAPSLEWSAGVDTPNLPFPAMLAAGPSVDYVGRTDLLARLTAARRRAAAGTCRALLLAGEPGVGKTRTAVEVARAAFAEGATVLYGRCDEDVSLPYQPFVEALDWYTRVATHPVLGRQPAELTRLLPLLPSRVPGVGAPVSADPRSEEYLLFEATTSWLVELARRRPLIVVIDDLHWASTPVLLLLRHVLRAAAGEPDGVAMLVIATYRDTEVAPDGPLAGFLADARRLAVVDRVPIGGLSRDEVGQYVARSVGGRLHGDTGHLAKTLHAATEGNPFFLDELLRHLLETGTVAGTTTVPQGVRDVVLRRVGRLSAPARQLLALAAVVGHEFTAELLAAAADVAEGTLLDAVDESLRARLVEETGADRYRFAHALVRATLLDELSATRRRRLHRRVAEALEKLQPDDVVALAFHFREAGLDALRYTLAAAEHALAARALADAEARFREALDMADGSPDVACRARALCGLGEAQRDQGDAGFRATLLEAARLAQEAGHTGLLVRAALSNSRGVPSVIGGLDEERLAVTQAALAAVGPESSPDRARLLAQLATEICFTRDDRRRLALADEAEAMARAIGDPALLAWVLNRTGYAAFSPQRVEQLVARGEEATRLSDATGDPSQRVLSRFFWSGALLTAGQLGAFVRVTEEMAVVAEQAPPTLKWLAKAAQPRLCMVDGDAAGVRRLDDDAFELAQELEEPDGAAWWMATRAMFAWSQGAFPSLTDALRAGIDAYPDEPAWSIGYVMCLAMDGRSDDARNALALDPPNPQELLDHVFPFVNSFMCGVIAYHLDDVDLAARSAEALRPHRSCWVHHYAGVLGPVGMASALCAATVGDLDEAVRLCEEAERALVDASCRGPLPQVHTYYAEILTRRAGDGDRLLARRLLDGVRRSCDRLEAPDLLARAEGLLALLDRPGPAPTVGA